MINPDKGRNFELDGYKFSYISRNSGRGGGGTNDNCGGQLIREYQN